MLSTQLKPKLCVICGREFIPRSSFATCCRQRCAMKKVRADNAEKVAKERQAARARREALETIPQLIKAAQKEFNAYIRARDAGKPCICCGLPLGDGEVGGSYDCGHYRSTGSAPHLRFDERNAHAQRKQCNRYGAGRAVDYRVGLIGRIGLAAVEALEADNHIHRWTREEVRSIRDTFRAKLRSMKSPQPSQAALQQGD